jgi:hypothetical protein
MTLVDDRVLEFLDENESGTPTKMKEEGPINYSRPYINRRCKKLAEKGLIKNLGNGVYVLSDTGKAYLDGRLDTQNWTRVDEDGKAETPDQPGVDNSPEVTGGPDPNHSQE